MAKKIDDLSPAYDKVKASKQKGRDKRAALQAANTDLDNAVTEDKLAIEEFKATLAELFPEAFASLFSN